MKVIKKIILSLSALMLAGCAGDEVVNNGSSTDERLPLRLEASLSGSRHVTRASGNEFENGDVLYSYVQHVYKVGDAYQKAPDIQASLVAFTKGTVKMVNGETSDLTPGNALYWDDFSKSTDDGANDLRTRDHGLRSYYGYCYNGTEITSGALTEDTGVLTWSTTSNQSTADALKKNDLLWSKTQDHVTYVHARDAHGTLNVPYTHAMSKFTIIVEAKEGFQTGNLSNTIVTLNKVSKDGTFDAPNEKVTASETVDVTMCPDGNTDALTRTYQAVTVPHTKLAKDNLLATITDAGGNNYDIKVTDEMLKAGCWGDGLASGETQSSVNYQLTVTINKQKVSVVATLADWTPVKATGTGEINFTADVKNIDKDNAGLADGDAFILWKMSDLTDEAFDKAIKTKVTYSGGGFTYDKKLYWDSALDNSFFRALAKKETTLTAVEEPTLAQGTDLLWGTTAAHKGTEANGTEHEYKEGVAINPRTGDVPLIFKHVMSNVVVKLETTTDDSQVKTDGATITMTKLNKDGKFSLFTGEITSVTNPSTITVSGETIMVPQDIDDEAKLIIELADHTTYSLLLNTCKDKDGAVKKWDSGKQYEYTITLKKEEIQFRVMVKDWEKDESSGNASLDWD